jgi:hypothetical protein
VPNPSACRSDWPLLSAATCLSLKPIFEPFYGVLSSAVVQVLLQSAMFSVNPARTKVCGWRRVPFAWRRGLTAGVPRACRVSEHPATPHKRNVEEAQ